MKRLLLLLLLASPCLAAHRYELHPPHIPNSVLIEADPPAQTHTFPALDTNNAFTGNNTHSGTETFSGLLQCKNVEGVRCIDASNSQGWAGTELSGWLASAVSAAGASGKIQIMPGTYSPTATLSIPSGFIVEFVGNPTLNFTLSGATPAFTLVPSAGNVNLSAVDGQFSLNMQNTGGTVFKLCGGVHWTFGPANGMINVSNITGNVMDVGPCASNQSADDFIVRNIRIATGTVPGDYVNIFVQNSAPAQFVLNGRFENLTNETVGGTTGIIGFAVRINSQFAGPQVNFNGITFRNCGFQYKSTNNNAAVHIQSSFSAGNGNSINFTFQDGYITFQGVNNQIVDIDSATTAAALGGIGFSGTMIFGGLSPSVPFSNTILASAPSTATLEFHAPSVGKVFARAVGISTSTNPIPSSGALNLSNNSNICWRNFTNAADVCAIVFNNASNFLDLSAPGGVFFTRFVGPGTTAGTGQISLASTSTQCWRNNANNADLCLGKNASDVLTFNSQTVNDGLHASGLVIASGTSTLTVNAALAAVTSQAAITTAATGALTTDAIEWSYASAPGAGDSLCHISPYVTAGNVNFVRTNPTAGAQSVSAIVINWRVIR